MAVAALTGVRSYMPAESSMAVSISEKVATKVVGSADTETIEFLIDHFPACRVAIQTGNDNERRISCRRKHANNSKVKCVVDWLALSA
jgi:hypothetical protein